MHCLYAWQHPTGTDEIPLEVATWEPSGIVLGYLVLHFLSRSRRLYVRRVVLECEKNHVGLLANHGRECHSSLINLAEWASLILEYTAPKLPERGGWTLTPETRTDWESGTEC